MELKSSVYYEFDASWIQIRALQLCGVAKAACVWHKIDTPGDAGLDVSV